MRQPTGTIQASALGLRTRAGWVYRDIDLTAPAGSFVVVTGPAGSGKTALLLTLAGRMQAGEGRLTVGSVDAARHPGAVRRLTGLGEFRGVNDLDETLSVADQVMAELALHGRPWRGAHVGSVLQAVGLDLDPRRTVRDLGAAERTLLGAALGTIGAPPVLVMDELDEDATPDETARVAAALRLLAGAGTTVVAGALDPLLTAAADVSLTLDAHGSAVTGLPARPIDDLPSVEAQEHAHALV